MSYATRKVREASSLFRAFVNPKLCFQLVLKENGETKIVYNKTYTNLHVNI